MPEPITIAVLAAGAVALSKPSDGSPVVLSSSAQSWSPLVRELATDDAEAKFAVAWLAKESNGNACAFGSANAKGPDGNPREIGLGQLYNPDDFTALGLSPSDFRAYCKPGTQQLTRQLTDDERRAQVAALLGLVRKSKARATGLLAQVGASWTVADTYRFTKLQHGLPGLASGIRTVTTKLGRAPGSWTEFRNTVVTCQLDAGTMRYKDAFARVLDNAQHTGDAVT